MSDLGKVAAPRPMSEERDEYAEIQVAEENLGTIVVCEKETDPRKALRPVPSLDPNDPLVSRQNPLSYVLPIVFFILT
jgi:hypothetical protein